MPRKKHWLFLDEVESDKTAFGLLLETLVKDDTVAFDVFHADIFGARAHRAGSDPIMRLRDADSRIRKEVADHLTRSVYDWGDLERVILIADTDGSFIPDEAVHENPNLECIQYYEDHIVVPNARGAMARNGERSANLRRVVGKGTITYNKRKIPVQVFFMSRNLEHALHNVAGHVTDRRKAYLANEFRSKFRNDIEGFVEFMTNTVAVPGDYHGTWKYISEGTHSLERGSNLHILLNETRRLS